MNYGKTQTGIEEEAKFGQIKNIGHIDEQPRSNSNFETTAMDLKRIPGG